MYGNKERITIKIPNSFVGKAEFEATESQLLVSSLGCTNSGFGLEEVPKLMKFLSYVNGCKKNLRYKDCLGDLALSKTTLSTYRRLDIIPRSDIFRIRVADGAESAGIDLTKDEAEAVYEYLGYKLGKDMVETYSNTKERIAELEEKINEQKRFMGRHEKCVENAQKEIDELRAKSSCLEV